MTRASKNSFLPAKDVTYFRSGFIGIAIFLFLRTAYVWVTFSQFEIWRLATFMFCFYAVTALAVLKVFPWARLLRFEELDLKHLSVILSWFFSLWVLSFSMPKVAERYFPIEPIGLLNSGGSVHFDSLFNVSIIQSILSEGLPSTGLDGSPVVKYHVLTHYFEAFVYKVSGIDAFEGQGYLYAVASVSVLTVLALLVLSWLSRSSYLSSLAGPVAVVPVLVGTWHMTTSQPLWLASILVIPAVSYLYSVSKKGAFGTKSVLLLSLISLVLSCAKISVGFIFALFTGFLVFSKQGKSFKAIPHLLSLAIPQILYAFWVLSDRSIGSKADHTDLHSILLNLKEYAVRPNSIFVSNILLIVCIFYAVKSLKINELKAVIGIQAIGLTFIGFLVAVKQNPSDVFYFVLALFSTSLIYCGFVAADKSFESNAVKVFSFKRLTAFLLFLVLPFTLFERAFVSVYHHNFSAITKSITPPKPVQVEVNSGIRIFSNFQGEVERFIVSNNLESRGTKLVVSRETYTEISRYTDTKNWALGLLIHSLTGLPLYKGVTELHENYGFSQYTEESLALPASKISQIPCLGNDTLIKVVSFAPAQFEIVCEGK